MIFSVTWQTAGTGVQSFAFPVSGNIEGVYATNQASAANISTNGSSAGTGSLGGDRSLITSLIPGGSQPHVVTSIDFPIDQNQLVFIDVKTAGTFNFFVRV